MSEREISKDEVDAFAQKLQDWSADLSEKEKVLLHAMLSPPESVRAGRSTMPIQGFQFEEYTIGVPLASLLYRFRYVQREGAAYVKEAGPSWVKFIQHHGIEDIVTLPPEVDTARPE